MLETQIGELGSWIDAVEAQVACFLYDVSFSLPFFCPGLAGLAAGGRRDGLVVLMADL